MNAFITLINNDGATRIVPLDTTDLVRPDPQDIGEVVSDLQELPKRWKAQADWISKMREVLDQIEGVLDGYEGDLGTGTLADMVQRLVDTAEASADSESRMQDAIDDAIASLSEWRS